MSGSLVGAAKQLALGAALSAAALLLPPVGRAESQLDRDVGGRAAAVAHVRFKIVIPQALSLEIPASWGFGAESGAVVGSTGRAVALTSARGAGVRQDMVLTSARGGLAAHAPCAAAWVKAPDKLVCTVTMP